MDFMGESSYPGCAYRLFNDLEECNREALAIEVDVLLPSGRVADVREQLGAICGKARQLRFENGPESLPDVMKARGRSTGTTSTSSTPTGRIRTRTSRT